jgi:hypothetical protein
MRQVRPEAHDDPAYLRRKAEELQALCTSVEDAVERATLVHMPQAYEWLAERAEARQR